MDKILKKIIEVPKENKVPLEFKKILEDLIKNNNIDADVFLGGSFAKDTHLKNYDCDIFFRFNIKYQKENISDILEKILKDIKHERLHGSRDYFKVIYKNIDIEIIPVIKIENSSEQFNITDVSPLHVIWVKNNIKGLNNDVRILKKFLKANNLYGAESHIKGFSGYVCEILIIKYGGFINLLKAILNWKNQEVIDVSNYYKNSNDAINLLDKSKTQSPIIIIDPVEKTRNAAAGLGINEVAKFILIAKQFLDKPNLKFFIKKEFDLNKLIKENKDNLIILNLNVKEAKESIMATRVLKIEEYLLKKLKEYDFTIFDSGWNFDHKSSTIWINFSEKKLPNLKLKLGPSIFADKKHIDDFLNKHCDGKIVIKEGKVCVIVKREINDIYKCLNLILNVEYIKDKVKKINFKVY